MEMDIPSFQLLRWVKVLNPYSLLLGYYHHEKIKERWIQKIPQDKSNLADFPILSTPLSRNEGSSTGHHRPLHSFQEHFSLGSGSNFMSGDRAYTDVTSMRVQATCNTIQITDINSSQPLLSLLSLLPLDLPLQATDWIFFFFFLRSSPFLRFFFGVCLELECKSQRRLIDGAELARERKEQSRFLVSPGQ